MFEVNIIIVYLFLLDEARRQSRPSAPQQGEPAGECVEQTAKLKFSNEISKKIFKLFLKRVKKLSKGRQKWFTRHPRMFTDHPMVVHVKSQICSFAYGVT